MACISIKFIADILVMGPHSGVWTHLKLQECRFPLPGLIKAQLVADYATREHSNTGIPALAQQMWMSTVALIYLTRTRLKSRRSRAAVALQPPDNQMSFLACHAAAEAVGAPPVIHTTSA